MYRLTFDPGGFLQPGSSSFTDRHS